MSRLKGDDWNKFKAELNARKESVVALDLPTSWMMATVADEMTGQMMKALNRMMLDMLAAIARKDYTDSRRRQQLGIEKLKAQGGYKGRQEDTKRNEAIMTMLRKGNCWNHIVAATGCSRSTLSRLAHRLKATVSKAAKEAITAP